MELMKAIETRYSCRGYLDKQVDEEAIESILHAGKCAPVGLKQYDDFVITVIQDENYLTRLDAAAEPVRRRPGSIFYGAPTVILVSGKVSQAFSGLEQCSASCILQNMLLAATEQGLGSVFIKNMVSVLDMAPELTAELELPKDFVPIAGMALGYADDEHKNNVQAHEIKVVRK